MTKELGARSAFDQRFALTRLRFGTARSLVIGSEFRNGIIEESNYEMRAQDLGFDQDMLMLNWS